jgi:hypothetical protein
MLIYMLAAVTALGESRPSMAWEHNTREWLTAGFLVDPSAFTDSVIEKMAAQLVTATMTGLMHVVIVTDPKYAHEVGGTVPISFRQWRVSLSASDSLRIADIIRTNRGMMMRVRDHGAVNRRVLVGADPR